MFEFPASIDGFNEADVREEIITPLLRHLGYRTGTPFNVIRELSLRYSWAYLGRKKPGRDPELRGKADYVLEVNGILRWTIEAKPSSTEITSDDIEQAFSYANHPEVRAVLFCVISGAEFLVFQTNLGPSADPILTLKAAEFPAAIQRIESVLSPSSLLRDHPLLNPDFGVPIGPGLRSVVRIVSGFFEFQQSEPAIPLLTEISWSIADGGIQRDQSNRLVAFVPARSPFRFGNELNRRLGFDRMELVSQESELSTREDAPSVFSLEMDLTLPSGMSVPNLLTGEELVLTRNLKITSTTVAQGTLRGTRFSGSVSQRWQYHDAPVVGSSVNIDASGQFELTLA